MRRGVVHSLEVIRKGDWKLLEAGAEYYDWMNSRLRLYNIREDPREWRDQASSQPEKVAELRARLAELADERSLLPDPEPFAGIPSYPPIVYGANEHAMYGAEVERALRLLGEGNPGPSLLRAEVSGRGVRLVYKETLDGDSVPPASAFRVVVNPGYRPAQVTAVELSGSAVLLTLAQPVQSGETVGLTYEVPDAGAIRDADRIAAVGVTWVTTLGAAFEGVPSAHDGLSSFTLHLRFSEPVQATDSALVESVLEVTGGQITQARQVAGDSALWELTVMPSGLGPRSRGTVTTVGVTPSRWGGRCRGLGSVGTGAHPLWACTAAEEVSLGGTTMVYRHDILTD